MRSLLLASLLTLILPSLPVEAQWQGVDTLNCQLGYQDIYFVNDSIGFIGGGCGMKKTRDEGRSWTSSNDSIHAYFVHFFFFNEDTGLVIGNPGYDVLKTTDGGLTWTSQFSYAIPSNFSFPFNDSIGFMASSVPFGHPSLIYKTTNFGESWTLIGSLTYATSNYEENYIKRIFFVDYNVGYASSDGGRLYKTINGGVSWVSTSFNSGQNIEYLYFTDSQTGFLLNSPMYQSNLGGLYRTDDGGNSWIKLPTGSFKSSFKSIVMFDSIGYLCAGREIMRSTDGGHTWSTEWTSQNSLIDMSFVDDRTGYALDYDSAYARYSVYAKLRSPDDTIIFIPQLDANPEVIVYQNPAHNCIELVCLNFPLGEQISCNLFDMLGTRKSMADFKIYDSKSAESLCLGNDFSSTNIYLLRVQSPSFRKVIKVIM